MLPAPVVSLTYGLDESAGIPDRIECRQPTKSRSDRRRRNHRLARRPDARRNLSVIIDPKTRKMTNRRIRMAVGIADPQARKKADQLNKRMVGADQVERAFPVRHDIRRAQSHSDSLVREPPTSQSRPQSSGRFADAKSQAAFQSPERRDGRARNSSDNSAWKRPLRDAELRHAHGRRISRSGLSRARRPHPEMDP